MTGPRLIPAILSLSSAGAAWAQPADTPDHLSAVPGMRFVPGRLTDLQTPPGAPHSLEVSHGYELLMDLGPEGGCPPNCAADADVYLIGQKPFSSYEAVVDSTSGDIGPILRVDRIVTATSVVLQSSVPIGVGFSRSLRWMNTAATEDNTQAVRVMSGQCATNCGPDDVYFIRGYETTYSIPRFNNVGSQVTVLLLQNPTSYPIAGNIYFWNSDGTVVIATVPFNLAAKQLLVFNSASVANGNSGTVTIANDGRYGDLSAKTVALEPATGFSFDSPSLPRIR